jgi:hypothetical protein
VSTKSDRKKAIAEVNGNRLKCPGCPEWILCQKGRIKLHTHIRTNHPDLWAEHYEALFGVTDWEVPLA